MEIYLFDVPARNVHSITKQVRSNPVSIGRGLDCDIVLSVKRDGSRVEEEDSDLTKRLAAVSREHATLTYDKTTKSMTLRTNPTNQSFYFDPLANSILPLSHSFEMEKGTYILYLGSGQYGPVIILQE